MDHTSKTADMVPPRELTCPECGFDLPSQDPCGVCGWDPKSRRARPVPHSRLDMAPFFSLMALLAIFSVLFIDAGARRAPEAAAAADPTPTVAASPAPAAAAPHPAAASAAPQAAAAPKQQPAATETPAPAPEVVQSPAEEPRLFDITTRNLHPPLTSRSAYIAWMRSHTSQQEKFLGARWDRLQKIIEIDGVANERVKEAFLLTPREYFCRDQRRAYESAALPIGYGQTISGPHMVARMTDYLNPQPDHKVLEIGTGSGYQSAVLSELSLHVYTIEIVARLAEETDAIYRAHQKELPEYGNIMRKVDDGYYGWIEHAPFDRIIVTCGIDHIPPELLAQLAPDGIMVIPVGPPSGQTILRIVKRVAPDGSISLEREDIFHGRRKEIFVPFTAKEGGVHTQGGAK